MAMFIVKPWYRKKDDAIYGAEWAGTSDPSWVRTDAAVGFSDPNPYYSGMSTTPSSPFDNIMPWSGMRRVTDASAGELVEIPKFYYKWTRDGVKMKLRISTSQFDGSHVSPAHADRGDGVGERDYVYVGRYHCVSDYKSKTGVKPIDNVSMNTFRSSIHSLGNNIWMQDDAIRWTIRMLYLVEFANWNAQTMIGYGCGNGSSVDNNGMSDNMLYHTGTMQTNRTTYATGIQYRHIENLWANLTEIVDGIYYSNVNVYYQKNPADYGTGQNGQLVGTRRYDTAWHYYGIRGYNDPSQIVGYEYALYPANNIYSFAQGQYITDCYYVTGITDPVTTSGGNSANRNQELGLFSIGSDGLRTSGYGFVGTRLMVLPSSRLAA